MKGEPPSPRDSHSCTTVGRRLFVFGGTDGTNSLNDLHILDASTNTWSFPAPYTKGPDAREGHSAALVGKQLFIFGGCRKSGNTHEEVYYNDLYILNTETLFWGRATTLGIPPVPRDNHTCSSWRNKLILIGGEDASDCYLSDVHILDAETLTWSQMTTSGQMLAPRAGHTTVALGSNFFVFGGFMDARNLYDDLHVLNIETGKWSRVTCVNRGPSACFSGAGDCLDEQRGILVFLGGCNQSLEALDDMHYLYTDMKVNMGPSQPRKDFFQGEEFHRRYIESRLGKCGSVPLSTETSGLSQPVNLNEYSSGTKTSDFNTDKKIVFAARVTGVSQHGYAIETVVNGKLFNGMLFSGTPRSGKDCHACINNDTRRVRGETGEELNSSLQLCSIASAIPREKNPDLEHVDALHRKDTAAQQLDLNLAISITQAETMTEKMAAENSKPVSGRNEVSGASTDKRIEQHPV